MHEIRNQCQRDMSKRKTAGDICSAQEEMEAIEKSSGVAWRELFDVVVSSSDVEASKPSPDSVAVAIEKLGLLPTECLFIGDTIYGAKASVQAGVLIIGVRTGPFPETADPRLVEAGARRSYENTTEILASFDEVLQNFEDALKFSS